MPSPGEVTAAYRARQLAARAGLLALVRGLWAAGWDSGNPFGSLARIAPLVAAFTVQAQARAVTEARGYLAALAAAATGVPLAEVAPFTAGAGLAGSAASGASISRMAGFSSAIYSARVASGQPETQAANASVFWLNSLAASEPARAGNQAVLDAAVNDDRLTGRFVRLTSPDACPWCKMIADRGYTYAKVGEGGKAFAAHPNCRCMPGPEIGHVLSRRGVRLATRNLAEVQPAGGAAAAENARAIKEVLDRLPTTFTGVGGARETLALQNRVRGYIGNAMAGVRPEVAANLRQLRTSIRGYDRQSNKSLAWMYYPPSNNMVIRASTLKGGPLQWASGVRPDRNGVAWWPRTIPEEKSGLENIVTHETGHFLHHQLDPTQARELNASIDAYLSTGNPIEYELSRYATKNRNELVAEAWAEYKLAPEPRPFAKMIGDKMMGWLS